jgi:hypothetical protein
MGEGRRKDGECSHKWKKIAGGVKRKRESIKRQ